MVIRQHQANEEKNDPHHGVRYFIAYQPNEKDDSTPFKASSFGRIIHHKTMFVIFM